MFKHSLLETKHPTTCQRCGGQIIRSWGEIACLQCGALHTQEGELLTHYAQELGLQLVKRGQRRSFGSYRRRSVRSYRKKQAVAPHRT